MKEDNTYYSTRVRLDMLNEKEYRCKKLLELVPRKKNRLLAIMADELMEKYGIDPDKTTKKQIDTFINLYSFVRSAQQKSSFVPMYAPGLPPAVEETNKADGENTSTNSSPPPIPSLTSSDSDFDGDKAKNVLSVFGI